MKGLAAFTFLAVSTIALADDTPDLSRIPPPPPPSINEIVQQEIKNNPQEPTIREELPTDRRAPPEQQPGANPAPPDDAPTYEEMNPNTDPAPREQEISD
ncbi:hypothetical protein [Pseudomonas protegens]|uniref:hypothetical protein n=1 Tax=Pseudomonas protegens TaxID=380021 RepID=UPI001B339F71|nr:hypothetical protein [Pseudomonas protegens]MBP5133494.1 hypothetical protein [Pseudomonas protegens]MBP5150677.1 hypothetical protein [Pseudomonas protegens]MBP5151076.1 hypothetical protein [Pseudomonas protegens]